MVPTAEESTNDLYMYTFRTSRCKSRRCRDPAICFDAHSNIMQRRVPCQVKQNNDLFNYIPEACAEWWRTRKCSMGDRCIRSHGWLEMIFHPLRYKTKLCESAPRFGVCSEYGIYCGKAHATSEIRNLLKIYGKNYQRHFGQTQRLGRPLNHNYSRPRKFGFEKRRVGIAVPRNPEKTVDIDALALSLLQRSKTLRKPGSLYAKLPSRTTKKLEVITKKLLCSNEKVEVSAANRSGVTSYTQLYSSNQDSERNSKVQSGPIVWKCKLDQDNCSQSSNEIDMASSNSVSPMCITSAGSSSRLTFIGESPRHMTFYMAQFVE